MVALVPLFPVSSRERVEEKCVGSELDTDYLLSLAEIMRASFGEQMDYKKRNENIQIPSIRDAWHRCIRVTFSRGAVLKSKRGFRFPSLKAYYVKKGDSGCSAPVLGGHRGGPDLLGMDINVCFRLGEMSRRRSWLQLYVLVTRDPQMSWEPQQLIAIQSRYLGSARPEQACFMLISRPSDKPN